MPAQWLSNSSDISTRASAWAESCVHYLSQPARLRRLRLAVLALLGLWLVLSLARLFWALFPVAEPQPGESVAVINPATASAGPTARAEVDIDALRGRHLFGDASAAEIAEALPEPEAAKASEREGIEKGARETRLQVTLRGVVSASEDGLGHAIIEYRNQQDVYAVDDKLPVSGNVVLAKVMPRQVVLDNNGTYELLTLFEQSDLDKQVEAPVTRAPRPVRAPVQGSATVVDKRNDVEATELARDYRDQLYTNPQSLADVVQVSAVREGDQLLGYRITPGKDARQFAQLGFKPGDVVTSVNGITLDDPSGAMRLYQTMRSASEAVFELQRGGQLVSISVSLGQGGG